MTTPRRWSVQLFVTRSNCESPTRTVRFITAIEASSTHQRRLPAGSYNSQHELLDAVALVEHHAGYCYDNAVMERFLWSLKHVWMAFESFANIALAGLSVHPVR